ncbi:MAG: AAA family ATPase [Desulfobacterales bacterium]|nr:AAA family ATPase [Desulfobacterales bacterium]
MRKFSSYGPIDRDLHYHVPRRELIERAYMQLTGEKPGKGGHYITVWAPRQAGKTWIMQQVVRKIREHGDFDIGIITMQSANGIDSGRRILDLFVRNLNEWFGMDLPYAETWDMLYHLFTKQHFKKPVVLIIDEFDALRGDFINRFANEFRDIYIRRQNESDKPSNEKNCVLHGLALIGVRSVLGIENVSGSPFNVQRSVRIPNLTYDEVNEMFAWYQEESGHKIEKKVIERLFYETRGQPGLVSWFGELLTEGFDDYKPETRRPTNSDDFEEVFSSALDVLPNNNILNIISKAKQEPHKEMVLNLFRIDEKIKFKYDDPSISFLYMNGVIDSEKAGTGSYVRFSSPFVQKRLFNYFSWQMFDYMGKLIEPFEDLTDTFARDGLNIRSLMRRFENHMKKNWEWLLKDAPRRKDLRIFEAVYHFNLYRYLCDFLGIRRAEVWPEFPTGNGKVDLIIKYADKIYAVEVKSFTDETGYREALEQAAGYGKQLELPEISLVFFVEYVDDANREKYEKDYIHEETGVRVMPVFVETGN